MRRASAQLCACGKAVTAVKRIASRDNPHFKALKRLCRSGRERRKTGRVLLDGMHLIESYAQLHGSLQEIIVSESGALRGEIARFLHGRGAAGPVSVLADALFDELALVATPTGIMAIVGQPQPTHNPNLEADTVVLDGIQDPGNLGSILRSSAAAGFRQVLVSADCAQAWSPKVLRAGMGAHFQLDIHDTCDICEFLGNYCGLAILTTLDAPADLYGLTLKGPVAWVFGSEGQGIRDKVVESALLRVRIPMPGAIESLNVAAAAAACLWETVRQRH